MVMASNTQLANYLFVFKYFFNMNLKTSFCWDEIRKNSNFLFNHKKYCSKYICKNKIRIDVSNQDSFHRSVPRWDHIAKISI